MNYNEEGHYWFFICESCGYDIYAFGGKPERELCATCGWLKDHPEASNEIIDLLRGPK